MPSSEAADLTAEPEEPEKKSVPTWLQHPPPVWSSNQKGMHCTGCVHAEEACLLRADWTHRASLTFVLPAPSDESVENGRAMSGRDEAVLRELVKTTGEKIGTTLIANFVYMTGAPSKKTPSKSVLSTCSPYATAKLLASRDRLELTQKALGAPPRNHVLVPMGKDVTEMLVGPVGDWNSTRGRVLEAEYAGKDWVVVPTLTLAQLVMKTGYARVMSHDISKAYRLSLTHGLDAKTAASDLSARYRLPRTIEGVEAECAELMSRIDAGEVTTISVDLETNTLSPYRTDAHTSVVSMSWDEGEALAFLVEHPDTPYDSERAWAALAPILASKVQKVFHNGKFDLQFLQNIQGLRVENVWWDTMLAEHFLDENKSGVYGLKQIVSLYAPAYVGYEDDLREKFVSEAHAEIEIDGELREPTVEMLRADPSYLMTYYADLEYTPVGTQGDLWPTDMQDVQLEVLELEIEYLAAHRAGAKKTKGKIRNKIRSRCKKAGVQPTATVGARKFEMGDQGYDHLPLGMLLRYAAFDADVTRQCCAKQRRLAAIRQQKVGITSSNSKLQADMTRVMRDLYIPGTVQLATMSYKGCRIDYGLLEIYEKEIGELAEESLKVVQQMTCRPELNPNSGVEMGDLVTKVLNIDPAAYQYTDAGALSVTDEWLETQQTECEDEFTQEVLYYIRIYKKAKKALTSFINKFRTLAQYDGRIHTSFNLNGTATGRLSSSGPNLQNVPLWMCVFAPHPKFTKISSPGWNIKALFIPSSEDRVFWQLDISAAEVRVLCAYAKDERLITAMSDPDTDIHSFIASHVFEPTYEEFKAGKDTNPELKLLRTATKRVLFGLIYGAGSYTIARQIYNGLATDPDERQKQIDFAQSVMDMVFARFPKIQEYITQTHADMARDGQVRTFFGRRRRFDLRNATWRDLRSCERQAVNFKIQSSASDIVLEQLCAVCANFDMIDGDVLLTVHDSMAGDCARADLPKLRAYFDHYIVAEVKRKFPWLPVPFKYDLEVGPNYGELVDYAVLENGIESMPERARAKVSKILAKANIAPFSAGAP